MNSALPPGFIAGVVSAFADAPPRVRHEAEGSRHLYDTPAWFAVEKAAGTDPRLLWAVSGSGGIAYTTVCTASPLDPPWPYARPDLLVAEIQVTQDPAANLLPALLLGGRRPGYSSIAIHPAPTVVGDDAAERAALTAALAQTAIGHARESGCSSVVAPFVDQATAAALGRAIGATGQPCLRARAGRRWVLRLPGNDFQDWFDGLERKAQARETATLRKQSQIELGTRPLRGDDLDWLLPLELDQYRNHHADYGATQARQLHEAYLQELGDRASIAVATHLGSPIGFVSIVRHGAMACVRQVGIRPGWEAEHLYFRLVYHEVIRWAYQNGVRNLDYSITADDAKRRRGAEAEQMFSLIALLSPDRFDLRAGYQPVLA